jgi:SAM-dependent methyltransferase
VKLRSLSRHWDAFGRTDPLWAVLADPTKKHNGWDIDEFFGTGRTEVASVLDYVVSLGIKLPHRRALDFGCGVGRITQALADHFDEVVGVDIAPSMIDEARKHNKYGERCRFVLNQSDSLRAFGDACFGFVYSNIVLQHIKPRHTRRYICEFLRLLAPGGLAVFQLPSHRVAELQRAGRLAWLPLPIWLRWRKMRQLFDFPRMDVYGIPRDEVTALVRQCGGHVIDVVPDVSAGQSWAGFRYCVERR